VWTDPKLAFSLMRHSGGDSHPMWFCLLGNLIGMTIAIVYRVLWDAIFTLPAVFADRPDGSAVGYIMGMIIGLIIGIALLAVFLIIFLVIAVYIKAGLIHLSLMMLGGANQGFDTTARVIQYTSGATALCGVIPVVGKLVQFFADIVIMSVGIANAHKTSGAKATFAVLIPYLLCLASIGALIFLLAASIWSAMNQA
jgi:hypothetical protein